MNQKRMRCLQSIVFVALLWTCGKKNEKPNKDVGMTSHDQIRGDTLISGQNVSSKRAILSGNAKVDLEFWQPSLPSDFKPDQVKLLLRNGNRVTLLSLQGESLEINLETKSLSKIVGQSLPIKDPGSSRILLDKDTAWDWSSTDVTLLAWDIPSLSLRKINFALKDVVADPLTLKIQHASNSLFVALSSEGLLVIKIEDTKVTKELYKFPKLFEFKSTEVKSAGFNDGMPWFLQGNQIFYPISRGGKPETWELVNLELLGAQGALPETLLSQPEIVKLEPEKLGFGMNAWTTQGFYWSKLAKAATAPSTNSTISTGPGGGGTGVGDPTWEDVVKPIFQSRCSGCHTSHQSWMSGSSFERSMIILEKNKIRTRVENTGSGKMPPYGLPELSADQKQKLTSWLQTAQ